MIKVWIFKLLSGHNYTSGMGGIRGSVLDFSNTLYVWTSVSTILYTKRKLSHAQNRKDLCRTLKAISIIDVQRLRPRVCPMRSLVGEVLVSELEHSSIQKLEHERR